MVATSILLGGLAFWRMEVVVEVPGRPSGLGWDPAGRLLVASMTDRGLLRLEGGRLVEVADLRGLAPTHINDMVVDARGRAYLGNFGYDFEAGEAARATHLIPVSPDGGLFARRVWAAPGRRTLIILTATSFERAECQARREGRLETVLVDVPGAGWP